MTRFKYAVLLSALGLTFSIPATAPAQRDIVVEGGLPTIHVSYADLDLSREAGVATLNSRVRGAARLLCSPIGMQPISIYLETRACTKNAIRGAAAQIDMAIASRGADRLAGRATIGVSARR